MDPHEVTDPQPVLTVAGGDGVRWACGVCNETVFLKDGVYAHFDKALNP